MKYLAIPFFLILFSSCASQYKLEQEAPIAIGDAYYIKTVAGQEASPVEYKIFIPVEGSETSLDDIYFRGKTMTLKREAPDLYTAVFLFLKNSTDLHINSNPQGEYGNEVPDGTEFPFQLEDNEAVISFKKGQKTRFFKIEKIIEKDTQYLPQKNRENNW